MILRVDTAILALCLAAATPSQTGDNVLIVIADDMGVDQVLSYGEGVAVAVGSVRPSGGLFELL